MEALAYWPMYLAILVVSFGIQLPLAIYLAKWSVK